MTNTLVFSAILFLLASFICNVQSGEQETNRSTESDAEEEEDKKLNILFGNDSLSSTPFPEGTTAALERSHKSNAVLDEETLWGRRLNISEYDELRDESKHDASPENSVDKDPAGVVVNHFLQEQPVTEAPMAPVEKERKPTTEHPMNFGVRLVNASAVFSSAGSNVDVLSSAKDLLHYNSSEVSAIEPSRSEEVVSLNSFHCAFGDEKCKVLLTKDSVLELKVKDSVGVTPSTTVPVPLWNIVKSSRIPEVSPSVGTRSSNVSTESVSPTESSAAETSENTISVDSVDIEKEEIVIHPLDDESDKAKLPKQDDDLEGVEDEWMPVKSSTPILNTPIKELVSKNPTSIRLLSYSSTPTYSSVLPALPIVSKIIESDSKTNNYQPYFSEDVKHIETPRDSLKVSLLKPASISPTVVSRDNTKSSFVLDSDKFSQTLNILETTTVLSPSFRGPSVWSTPETEHHISSSFLESSYSSVSSSVLPLDTSTPLLEPVTVEDINNASTTPAPPQGDSAPPPRVTNPSCSTLPICVEITLLGASWDSFCGQTYEFREFLSRSVSHYTRPVFPHHIVLDAEPCQKAPLRAQQQQQNGPDIVVPFYVTDDSGEYEERLTEICGVILRKWAPTAFRSSVLEVRLFNTELQSTPLPLLPDFNSGFVAAVSISAVAGVALCLLCILLVIMKQKMLQARSSDTATPTADAYSLDSLSINASFRRRRTRRSARSYLNHAFNDQEIPSHPLNAKTLANCLKSRDLLEEEFRKIPMNMPKLDTIPEGAHVKNRYSNILPRPESRVVLTDPSSDPLKSYINANFVKGYDGKPATYITCQAPLPEGIEDFWRMVWEQQSKVIIMLTMFEENGTSRCAMYFPQSTLVSQQPHGDFQVSLLKKDVYEFYTMSTLRLLDLEKNLFRDIVHLWFTGWPDVGVPKDPSSLMTFVQQCKPYINANTGPTIVHCSTGTGRTGVYLALEICSREYEESRSVDILQCVSQLRKDRAGAVQNKDQYILIYEAMLEYTTRVANQTHCPQNGTA